MDQDMIAILCHGPGLAWDFYQLTRADRDDAGAGRAADEYFAYEQRRRQRNPRQRCEDKSDCAMPLRIWLGVGHDAGIG